VFFYFFRQFPPPPSFRLPPWAVVIFFFLFVGEGEVSPKGRFFFFSTFFFLPWNRRPRTPPNKMPLFSPPPWFFFFSRRLVPEAFFKEQLTRSESGPPPGLGFFFFFLGDFEERSPPPPPEATPSAPGAPFGSGPLSAVFLISGFCYRFLAHSSPDQPLSLPHLPLDRDPRLRPPLGCLHFQKNVFATLSLEFSIPFFILQVGLFRRTPSPPPPPGALPLLCPFATQIPFPSAGFQRQSRFPCRGLFFFGG